MKGFFAAPSWSICVNISLCCAPSRSIVTACSTISEMASAGIWSALVREGRLVLFLNSVLTFLEILLDSQFPNVKYIICPGWTCWLKLGYLFIIACVFPFEVCGNKCIPVFPQTFSQEELIFKLWMSWSISTFQSWVKPTCIVLVDLVSVHGELLYWLLDSLTPLAITTLLPLFLLSRAFRTLGSRHQPNHLWRPLQPERDRRTAWNGDKAHPRHHWQEPICGRVPQWDWWRSQAMSQ